MIRVTTVVHYGPRIDFGFHETHLQGVRYNRSFLLLRVSSSNHTKDGFKLPSVTPAVLIVRYQHNVRTYHGKAQCTQCLTSNGSTKACVTTLPTSHPAIWLLALLLLSTTSHRVLHKAPGKRTRVEAQGNHKGIFVWPSFEINLFVCTWEQRIDSSVRNWTYSKNEDRLLYFSYLHQHITFTLTTVQFHTMA